GFRMIQGFDSDPESAKARARTRLPIHHIEELEARLANAKIDIAVLAVPTEHVQPLADRLIAAGINAILNFVPMHIEAPPHVHVRYVDLSLELESLSYYVQDDE